MFSYISKYSYTRPIYLEDLDSELKVRNKIYHNITKSKKFSKKFIIFQQLLLSITICIVMGRADAFAMSNSPKDSILDGLGNGIGYGSILIIVSMLREIFGSGQIYGYQIIPLSIYLENGGWYMNNGLMLLAPGAFIVLGLLIWLQRTYTGYTEE